MTEHHFLPPKAIRRYVAYEAIEAADATTALSDGAVYLRMVCVQMFWAGAFVASEIALAEQPPALTAVVRFVLTTVAYALLCATIGRGARAPLLVRLRQLTRGEWGALVPMGFFGVALYTLLVHRGLGGSTAANAGLLIPTIQPIFTALLSRLLFRDIALRALDS